MPSRNTETINYGGYTIVKPKNISLKKCLALHNIPINPDKAREQYIREKKLAEKRKSGKRKSKNHSKGNDQPKNCRNSPEPEDPNDDKKKHKINTMTKTEFFKSVKNEYQFYKEIKGRKYYQRKPGAKGLDKHAEYLRWDNTHSDVEAYNKRGWHIGDYDPMTKELYRPAVRRNMFY